MAALKEMGEGVVAAFERQERLLEPLLTLARCEYGHLRREPVDLAATAAGVLRAHDHGELRSTLALEPARTTGDLHNDCRSRSEGAWRSRNSPTAARGRSTAASRSAAGC
jgi:hypothetical protein